MVEPLDYLMELLLVQTRVHSMVELRAVSLEHHMVPE